MHLLQQQASSTCLLLVAQGFGKLANRILVHTLLVKGFSLLGVTLKEAWLHSIRLDPCKSLRCSQIKSD